MSGPRMSHFETCGICHTAPCKHTIGTYTPEPMHPYDNVRPRDYLRKVANLWLDSRAEPCSYSVTDTRAAVYAALSVESAFLGLRAVCGYIVVYAPFGEIQP